MTLLVVCLGCFIVFGSPFSNIYLDLEYVYTNNSYTEKKLMQQLGYVVDDDYVYEIYSIAFTSCNVMKPISNDYELMRKEIDELEVAGYLDYSDFDFPRKMYCNQNRNNWWDNVTYERDFSTFGYSKSISFYKIEH